MIFSSLINLVPQIFPQRKDELIEKRAAYSTPMTLKDNDGVEHEYNLEVVGWIGIYITTRGRKLK